MVLNTLTVGAAVTPAAISTYISHYTNRKPLRQKPTAHISYHEGLRLIRQFLHYASHHTVEEVQAFTAQWVPHPRWVKVDQIPIPQEHIDQSAETLIAQLGENGIQKVGGKQWWQWRQKNHDLKAEWIEMRSDYNARKAKKIDGKRVMLYIHGGAYFFGSTDEHRYQMQRHARKLRARVFAPRYRLAPQFPFPCGLQDCLAAYLYLLTIHEPSEIVFAGDSAGGGMILSTLITLRDQGLPLPAGTILISPWVDLTHSFPSLAGSGELDYIPAHGFMQRPSPAWPPPNDEEMAGIRKATFSMQNSDALAQTGTKEEQKQKEEEAVQGFTVHPAKNKSDGNDSSSTALAGDGALPNEHPAPAPGHFLSIKINDDLIELKDQIQMYTTNQLISHPLVSPVLQPSLGGLPPMLILTGGGELLRDEQIYLAHKAANPSKYQPSEAILNEYDPDRTIVYKYKPTDVQLQVWDDLCHVAPTLSFTRPAKYMYRSIANFGAWALARAQQTVIEIQDDDQVSIISSTSSQESSSDETEEQPKAQQSSTETPIGKAGDPLPKFHDHMIRHRVDRHGLIFHLSPAAELPALNVPPMDIGAIKEGPVSKWITAKKHWDKKYASEKRRVQKQRIKDMLNGFEGFGPGETPPPCALAGRRRRTHVEEKERHKKSWGLMLWTYWGSSHDHDTLRREEEMESSNDTAVDTTTTTGDEHGTETTTTSRPRASTGAAKLVPPNDTDGDRRPRSRRRAVSDIGQADSNGSHPTAARGDTLSPENPNGMADIIVTPTDDRDFSERSSSPQGINGLLINKPLAYLRPSYNAETASIRTTSTTGTQYDSDAASTTAVFAAPGVLSKFHTRQGMNSSDDSGVPGITVNGDDNDSIAPETSRRGSLESVERLRGHQLHSDVHSDTASTIADVNSNGGRKILDLERNLSSTAVRGVEGVIKPISLTNGSFDSGKDMLKDTSRPNMPSRDEFVTASEI